MFIAWLREEIGLIFNHQIHGHVRVHSIMNENSSNDEEEESSF